MSLSINYFFFFFLYNNNKNDYMRNNNMYYGETAIDEFDINEQLQIQYYIENYFLEEILCESMNSDIADAINRLKKKDIKEITDQECQAIVNKIMRIENNKVAARFIVDLLLIFIDAIMLGIAAASSSTIAMAAAWLLILFPPINILFGDRIPVPEKVMRALMKCQAKLTIQSL